MSSQSSERRVEERRQVEAAGSRQVYERRRRRQIYERMRVIESSNADT